MSSDNTFDLERLRVLPWLGGVEHHEAINSTNARATELAQAADIATPHLVLAQTQTNGRGRGANQWWSAPGALTFSVLLEPGAISLQTERWPRSSLCAALAVRDVVAERASEVPCGIKWPNDVFLGGRKICGILVEAPPRKGSVHDRLVIGVGVNVNNSLFSAPNEIRHRATSLLDATRRAHSLTELLEGILGRLEMNLQQLAEDRADLAARWQRHSLLDGRTVTVDLGTRRVTGYCLGINQTGALELATEFGPEPVTSGVVAQVVPELAAMVGEP